MKKIQDINLFFADNFNRYLDNITIRELIDVYIIHLEQKKVKEQSNNSSIDINSMKLPLININMENNMINDILEDYVQINTTTINIPNIFPIRKQIDNNHNEDSNVIDRSVNLELKDKDLDKNLKLIKKNHKDILDNIEYREFDIDNEQFNEYYVNYISTDENNIKIDDEKIDLTSCKSRDHIQKVLIEYFGEDYDNINKELNVVYHESSSDSESDWDDDTSSNVGSVISKTTSMCSFYNDSINKIRDKQKCSNQIDINRLYDNDNFNDDSYIDIETFNKYIEIDLTEDDKLVILEFLNEKLKICHNKNIKKMIHKEFKFVASMIKPIDKIKDLTNEFIEFVNSSQFSQKFNNYSKHFIKNMIRFMTDLAKDYSTAYRLYNYICIKDINSVEVIRNLGITPFLPLGDTITSIDIITSVDNQEYKKFNISEFNKLYPNTYCDTCILINTNKIKCSHRIVDETNKIGVSRNYDLSKLDNVIFFDGNPVRKSLTKRYRLVDYFYVYFKDSYSHLLSKQTIDRLYEKYTNKLNETDKININKVITRKIYDIITKNRDIKEYDHIYNIINDDYKKYWLDNINVDIIKINRKK